MANSSDRLTAVHLKNAKPRDKAYKLSDGKGLYLEVTPKGGRYWRMKYRHDGKEKRLAIGVYPDVTLAKARKARDDARAMLTEGIDPSARKQAAKAVSEAEGSFEAVAREWLALQKGRWSTSTHEKAEWMLETFLFPYLGSRPAADITAPELLAALRRVEARGIHETTHRVKQRAGQVFRYAVATGRAERDPSADLKGALAPVASRNHAALTRPDEIAELLRAIDGYQGHAVATAALKLAPLVFVRPGELRRMEWQELDLDAAEWRIPASKMKMREAHIVPLSRQAVAILRELEPLTGRGQYVFPSVRTASRPMSENTLNAALRRLGYTKEQMTAHGFRAMASTRLNEMGWDADVIERQLAHAERNKVRAAYNRAQYLTERRRMMQAWADYLDGLKCGAKIVPIKKTS